METQCPNCQARFKADDKYQGKKVNCPKCSRSFVIVAVMQGPVVESCTRCGKKIGRIEQACILNGKILCKGCDQILRKVSKGVDSGDMRTVKPEYASSRQKLRWLPLGEANKVGIAISVLFLLSGIYTISQGPRKETGIRSMTIEGKLASVTYVHTLEYQLEASLWIAVGLCLLVRSFLSGLGLARGVIAAFGAYLSTLPLVLIIGLGLPKAPGVEFMEFSFWVLGIAVLIFGFRPDKDHKEKSVAVVLAILCGPFAWLYVYRGNWWKFWLNIPLCLISPLLFLFPFLPLLSWIWAIIDMAIRPASYFENYIAVGPTKK